MSATPTTSRDGTKLQVSEHQAGSTRSAGQTTDEGKGRIFPCEGCGADLTFHIGQQRLKCSYCGFEKEIELPTDQEVAEQDFHSMLARLREWHESDQPDESGQSEVRCESCGGTVVFVGTLTSSECPYCASPIQRENVHTAAKRIPVDGVLAFRVTQKDAQQHLGKWVKSRWFAPNDFVERGVSGKLNGIYLPYWTFDTLTFTRYSGQRGEHYWVTVGTGKQRRRVRRTRWYPAAGEFQRFFDDVLVLATAGLRTDLMESLEPWPLAKCVPFNQQMLAGFLARTYEIELDEGFVDARERIDRSLKNDVRQRIGGDEQRIDSIRSQYDAIQFKHLLLPVWLLAYRYKDRVFQVMINATTGEVQGERPYSWVKITLCVLGGITLAAMLGVVFSQI